MFKQIALSCLLLTSFFSTLSYANNNDALEVAYNKFKNDLNGDLIFQNLHRFGFGYNPLLNTTDDKITGFIELNFATQQASGEINSTDPTLQADLWLVRNTVGSNGTVRPEIIDTRIKVGEFVFNGNNKHIVAPVNFNVEFDFDFVIVTPRGVDPVNGVLASGARTLFEKRFYREKFNQPSNFASLNAEGTVAATDDELVKFGAHLFFNETFGGNGRTCGTCHRAENNFSLDADFIATLDSNDPLFVHERVPQLALLEDATLLRTEGLIKENIDGFDDLANKFVMRSVNHLSSIAVVVSRASNTDPTPHGLGWSGDGSPGRGTLAEFVFGAINQHFPLSLNRTPGTDFRIPRQREVEALEAFQLSIGQQDFVNGMFAITFRNQTTQNGMNIMLSDSCFACHGSMFENNAEFDTGTVNRPSASHLPFDDGNDFEGSEDFNSQTLLHAADTAPYFHNNSAQTLEEAILHYASDAFALSPEGNRFGKIEFTPTQLADITDFMRSVNVLDNMQQVRKNFTYIAANPDKDSDAIVAMCKGDLNDVIRVLDDQNLYPQLKAQIQQVIAVLEMAKDFTGANKTSYFNYMIDVLTAGKDQIMLENPAQVF
ncbi:hypothetical protein [Teredinibacter sp. KSP-S5-2]|uniref:hypothetical protein n=1 Tax=Teredinibacter sp. KSP-S5-2 TaxID=3034506 RepID=UPI0029352002|nr:hypothetical protein [Teredinibacter sp. KSP-S5-2]WNO08944.1 hypothetical protein P5V12_18520 [Teredinibacter sp. KSP-S5-2]